MGQETLSPHCHDTFSRTHAHKLTRARAHMPPRIHAHAYTHTRTRTRLHTRTPAHTHTHTHTHTVTTTHAPMHASTHVGSPTRMHHAHPRAHTNTHLHRHPGPTRPYRNSPARKSAASSPSRTWPTPDTAHTARCQGFHRHVHVHMCMAVDGV